MEAKLFAGILLRSRNRREISIKRLKNSAALYVFDVFFFPLSLSNWINDTSVVEIYFLVSLILNSLSRALSFHVSFIVDGYSWKGVIFFFFSLAQWIKILKISQISWRKNRIRC